eukprot:TRINITY_DN40612_c0_g1_i1.p1 TRINITY_DN40612_c0_g1~~TRINITY_DN40612_c0_g1_i1.p1  ORF type:complete len:415 (-),score=36.75 TRINITY_DN40612_c0_g1_i1:148-1392(-)
MRGVFLELLTCLFTFRTTFTARRGEQKDGEGCTIEVLRISSIVIPEVSPAYWSRGAPTTYVKIMVGQEERTLAAQSSFNPKWEEEVYIPVKPSDREVTFVLLHRRGFMRSDFEDGRVQFTFRDDKDEYKDSFISKYDTENKPTVSVVVKMNLLPSTLAPDVVGEPPANATPPAVTQHAPPEPPAPAMPPAVTHHAPPSEPVVSRDATSAAAPEPQAAAPQDAAPAAAPAPAPRSGFVPTLTIKDLSCRVARGNVTGKTDSYFILRLNEAKVQTSTIHNSLNPNWGAWTHTFKVVPGDDAIVLELYDKDTVTKHDTMGRAVVDFRNSPNQWFSYDERISDSKGQRVGQCSFSLLWAATDGTGEEVVADFNRDPRAQLKAYQAAQAAERGQAQRYAKLSWLTFFFVMFVTEVRASM